MARLSNFSKELRIAFLLGLITLTVNLVGRSAIGASWPDTGAFFLFVSAGALGVSGAALSVTIGKLPEALLFDAYPDFFRVFVLVLGAASLLRMFPRLPLFVPTAVFWVTVVGPALSYFMKMGDFPPTFSTMSLPFAAVWDVLLAVGAGIVLLNRDVWAVLTGKPRHITLPTMLVHMTAFIAVFAFMTAFFAFEYGPISDLSQGTASSPVLLLVFFLMGLIVSTMLAFRVSSIIYLNSNQLLTPDLLPKPSRERLPVFSSDFWKRNLSLSSELTSDRMKASSHRAPPHVHSSIESGICAIKRDGTIAFANERFKEMAGISLNDIIGKKFDTLPMESKVLEGIKEALDNCFVRGVRKLVEVRLNQLPAKLKFLSISAETPPDAKGGDGPSSALVTLEDITDKRTMEFHIITEQRLASLGTLVSGMSHAFNNVLTTIAGQASFARHADHQEVIKRALDSIIIATKEAGILVRQLLEFAEVRPCNLRVTSMKNMLESHLDLLRRAVGESFEVIFETTQHPCSVLCDQSLMTQVMTNLVLNSKESYQGRQGSIFISLETEKIEEEASFFQGGARPGEYVRLRVKDQGRGMSADILSHAFDPQFLNSRNESAINLGLATVFAIVRAHDGFLSAESHLEKGTTISIYLPLVQAAEKLSGDKTTAADSGSFSSQPLAEANELNGGAESILVVEDDENIREVVCAMLSTLGYSVTSCANAHDALKKLSEKRFDLVLADMVMPRMHGLELIQQLRSSHPQLKTLMMTGSGLLPKARDQKLTIIPKPFDIDTLAKAVRTCLGEESKNGSGVTQSELEVSRS